MSFSPRYPDDHSQLQPLYSWERTPLYTAPTPGNFGRTPTPPVCSPSTSQIADESPNTPPRESQAGQFHYLIDWKVKLNHRPAVRITEPDLVIAPSAYWQETLKKKVQDVKRRQVFRNRRARLDDTTIVASVNDRSTNDLHQEFEGLDIDWTVIERHLLQWNNLLRKGKKIKLDICVNYLADDNEPRGGEKRGSASVTKTMLADRDAQIDAEQSSGLYSPWRDVYNTLRCPGSPCDNYDGHCWQDPVGKKHYKLKTHHLRHLVGLVKKKKLKIECHNDVPDEVRQQLYAEERQRLERQRNGRGQSSIESSPSAPINIHFLPAQSPQCSSTITPAGSPPLLPYTGPSLDDAIMIPDLPLDVAVREYSDWQQTRVNSQVLKNNVEKACDIALTNGLDLRQINKDRNAEFFVKNGVVVGVARRFVDDIQEWLDGYQPA